MGSFWVQAAQPSNQASQPSHPASDPSQASDPATQPASQASQPASQQQATSQAGEKFKSSRGVQFATLPFKMKQFSNPNKAFWGMSTKCKISIIIWGGVDFIIISQKNQPVSQTLSKASQQANEAANHPASQLDPASEPASSQAILMKNATPPHTHTLQQKLVPLPQLAPS